MRIHSAVILSATSTVLGHSSPLLTSTPETLVSCLQYQYQYQYQYQHGFQYFQIVLIWWYEISESAGCLRYQG